MTTTLWDSKHKFNLDCQDLALLLVYKYYPRIALSVSSSLQQPQFLRITLHTQSLLRKPQVFPKEMYLTLSTFSTPTPPTKNSPYTSSSTHQNLKKLSNHRSDLLVGESSNIIIFCTPTFLAQTFREKNFHFNFLVQFKKLNKTDYCTLRYYFAYGCGHHFLELYF